MAQLASKEGGKARIFPKGSLASMKDRITGKLFRKSLNRRLLRAMDAKDIPAMKSALERGADPNASVEKEYSDHSEGYDTATRYRKKGQAFLDVAAQDGNVGIMGVLIDAGADVNSIREGGGWTVLMTAIENDRVDACRLLVEKGADVNARTTWKNETVLMHAAEKGNHKICKLLVENKADVNATDEDGNNALMKSAENGYDAKTCEMLIREGLDVNAKNNSGETALIRGLHEMATWLTGDAPSSARLGVSKALMRNGADLGEAIKFVNVMGNFFELRKFTFDIVLERAMGEERGIFKSRFMECVKP